MIILLLLAIPLVGVFLICIEMYKNDDTHITLPNDPKATQLKLIALQASLVTLLVSMVIFTLHNFSSNSYQFVQEFHEVSYFNLYLGVDGLSLYFVILTTIIMPVSLLSN